MITLKRAYEAASPDDGVRVLVDGIWPRGVSKAEIAIDRWERDLAPSRDLRKWFGHDPARWAEFHDRYLHELADPAKQPALDRLVDEARRGPVTLVYSARDTEHNQAQVLRELLETRGA